MIIGAAFGKIVDSVVKDLIMPLVNLVGGGQIDFSNKYLVLSGQVPAGAALVEAQKLGNVFAYGNFITIAINFGILALVIFMMIKQVNRLRQAPEQAATVTPAPTPEDVLLLREIRDTLSRRPLADSRLTHQG